MRLRKERWLKAWPPWAHVQGEPRGARRCSPSAGARVGAARSSRGRSRRPQGSHGAARPRARCPRPGRPLRGCSRSGRRRAGRCFACARAVQVGALWRPCRTPGPRTPFHQVSEHARIGCVPRASPSHRHPLASVPAGRHPSREDLRAGAGARRWRPTVPSGDGGGQSSDKGLAALVTRVQPRGWGGHWGKDPRPGRTENTPRGHSHLPMLVGADEPTALPAPGTREGLRRRLHQILWGQRGPPGKGLTAPAAPGSSAKGRCLEGARLQGFPEGLGARILSARRIVCVHLAQLSPGSAPEQCLASTVVAHGAASP